MSRAYAHSVNEAGKRHLLVDHLQAVANLARGFASSWGGGDAAYYSGLWHDVGKFSAAFQEYLLDCETRPEARGHGPDHKRAGALLAQDCLGGTAMVVQGHHGGMTSPSAFKTWLSSRDESEVTEALRRAEQAIAELKPQSEAELPDSANTSRTSAEMFVRMVFSALVDSDYLDTEQHFKPGRAEARGASRSLGALTELLESHVRELGRGKTGPVAETRQTVYDACIRAASEATGVYRLAAPTGSGKTLAAMAFALRHAETHGLRRVIVGVPFISITEQTASVYRKVFGGESGDAKQTVLEHHSAAGWRGDEEDFHKRQVWSRLAAENWDAPIVVTTTVQLFESLFSNRPSDCRKLHRIADSVVIIDEAQALPLHLLRPILDGLRQLSDHYGSTVLISTATQPAFEAIREFAEVPAKDILSDPGEVFQAVKRVEYDWRIEDEMSWEQVAAELLEQKQALVVVNTKTDAVALLDALGDSDALHLSTLLCGLHRRRTIEEIKRRLAGGDACLLVSTQVIEAGVDLDFPFAMRALAPLDAVIQTAGRCNREGNLEKGRLIVFRALDGGSPPGAYRTGIGITGALLGRGGVDPDDPSVATEYFRQLFDVIDTDREHIQELRQSLNYSDVASRFRMIDDDTEPVAITSYGTEPERKRVRHILDRLKAGTPDGRLLMRRLQPYLVSLRRRQADRLRGKGLIVEVTAGVGEWLGKYDGVRGLVADELDPDVLVV